MLSKPYVSYVSQNLRFFAPMSFYKQTVIGIVCICLVYGSFARQQFSGWVSVYNFFRFSKSFSIECDATLHSTDKWLHTQSNQEWIGLLYHFNEHWNIGLGYSFFDSRESIDDNTGYAIEHQGWEQLLVSYPLQTGKGIRGRRGTLLQRVRLENRFIPQVFLAGNSIKSDGTLFANRFRYLVRNQMPLLPTNNFTRGPYIAVHDEVYLNISGRAKRNVKWLDQNRSYIGTGYRFHKKLDVELGYLLQYSETTNSDTRNNIIQLSGFMHL